ncbi:MAG TPA: winged helix DNA-binding domain-containing protein [Gemmatimonadaceae bacterium]
MDIVRQRLARQYLTKTAFASGSEVVRALGAVQSQDYAGAKWGLSQRTTDATDADIEREFTDGAILRTHVLRPTWHFVDPIDIRWMLALTAPRVKAAMASYNRKLELDASVFRRSHAALAKALAGGQHRTRTELRGVLERARIGTVNGQRLGHLMMEAELDAVVCSGPRRGKQFTYALFDERVAPGAALARDEALLALTRRYFETRGPATVHDFAWWSGLAMSDARRGIEIAGRDLQRVTLADRPHWLAGDTSDRRAASAHLLPNYDEYFIGYKDRGAIGRRLRSVKAVTGGNALIAHVVVVDGQLAGGWRRTVGRGAARVSLELLTALTAAERNRIATQVRRLGSFLGETIDLVGLA